MSLPKNCCFLINTAYAHDGTSSEQVRSGVFLLIAVLLLLVATGRVHWIAVAITTALPVLKTLLSLLLGALPFLQVWLKKRHSQSEHPTPPSNSQLTEE